jgi:hypothetical protein
MVTAKAKAASIKVSSRVIWIPRRRHPSSLGSSSRFAGTADAISSSLILLLMLMILLVISFEREFDEDSLLPEAVPFESTAAN